MIQVVKQGEYSLITTNDKDQILNLSDKGSYAWMKTEELLWILYKRETNHKVIRSGKYRLYKVKNEKKLTTSLHLELSTGKGNWQGYLLLSNLPTNKTKQIKIVPTDDIITRSSIKQFV